MAERVGETAMNLQELSRKVYEATAPGVGNPGDYVDYEREVRECLAGFSGVKTSISYDWLDLKLDWIRLSVVFSDFTSWYMAGKSSSIKFKDKGSSRNWPSQVTLPMGIFEPGGYLEDVVINAEGVPNIYPALMYPEGDAMKRTVGELAPLAESGRIMIRPKQIIMGDLKKEDKNGSIVRGIFVEPDTPGEGWARQTQTQESMPLKSGQLDDDHMHDLAAISIPYVTGIPIKDLAKLMDDEEHNLAEFRRDMRKLLEETKVEPSKANEIFNDVVRPSVSRVEKRFRSITNIHRLRLGGAIVGTAAISLVAYTATGVGASIAALLGVSGAGVVTREMSEYLKARSELPEMPHYLLWRLSKLGR